MLDEEEYGSDSSDDDYVPNDGEVFSEEEGSGEEENFVADDNTVLTGKRKGKTKKSTDDSKRKRKGGIKLEGEDVGAKEAETDTYSKELAEQIKKEKEEKKKEEEKKKSDSLWADFMKDVGPKTKPKAPAPTGGLASLSQVCKATASKPQVSATTTAMDSTRKTATETKDSNRKITITKEYDFAGEMIKVTKEVDANSKEAKAEIKKKEEAENALKPTAGPSLANLGVKRPGGGLGSVLGKIGKKAKMSTLEKSKLDWDSFKKDEGIDEDLTNHNKGKQGYIERQRFLERADHRQFEMEKNMRLGSKR